MKQLISDHSSSAKIEVDGGVGLKNGKEIIQAGADILVAGNAIFSSQDPMQTITDMKGL